MAGGGIGALGLSARRVRSHFRCGFWGRYKKWQGTWKLVAYTYDGEPQMADMEWIVDGDHYNIRLNGHLHEDLHMFKLDASRKQIDIFHHETPPGTYGGKLRGIYEISGDSPDCVLRPDRPRIPEIL